MFRYLSITLSVLFLGVLILVGCASSDRHSSQNASENLPPRSASEQKIEELRDAIIAYSHKHGSPPKSLNALGAEKFRDGWGNEIAYTIGTDSTVRLWSFGEDNQIGGIERDADIVVVFNPNAPPSTAQIAVTSSSPQSYQSARNEHIMPRR